MVSCKRTKDFLSAKITSKRLLLTGELSICQFIGHDNCDPVGYDVTKRYGWNIHEIFYFRPDFMGGTSLVEMCLSNFFLVQMRIFTHFFRGTFGGVDCWSNTSPEFRHLMIEIEGICSKL